ncbi:MAG: hypothetical protein ACR2QZ_00730 [Woeseiaceae bacterium]
MCPKQPLYTGVLLIVCGVAMAQDCSSIAGDWQGTWSETDCFGDMYSGDWHGEVTTGCQFIAVDAFGNTNGSINPLTGVLTAPTQSSECGLLSLTGTFQNNVASGSWTYSLGGGGMFSGNKVLVDTDGDGDPDITDPDDDNDGIGDALDTLPLTASNSCTGGDGINATLQSIIVVDVTCAASQTVTVLPMTAVYDPGHLRLIAPQVTFHSGVDAVRLTVTTADPCPGCPA